MKIGMYLLGGILILLTGCRFTEDKNTAVKKNKVKDTTVIEKKIIQSVPVTPQSVPYQGQYCFIKKIYTKGDTSYIEADYIQFLMGDEAIAAATKKGEQDMVQDDYYVVNDNTKLRSLALSKNVVITLAGTDDGKPSSAGMDDGTLQKKLLSGIFVIRFENGLVTNMREQFIP